VLAIKQTLYRAGSNSPIVEALKEACSRGKQVAALVELKARFDEENNIGWARALESAGVHVVYGLPGLKTHAKLCLVVRREKDGIRRYIHLGTGNYNAVTAGIYTDFGLFTANQEIGADVSDLFNVLTGYSAQKEYRKLLVAPHTLRREIISRIDREIACHAENGGGRLIFKLNAISDKESIDALYRASRAGVRIDIQVRGICCLRPKVEGFSENIRVTSVVGRFLEHTRAFYFRNGGDEELFLGSADLMTRNLDRRVECLFPVESPEIRGRIMNAILPVHLGDNVQCGELESSGEYRRLEPLDAPPLDSQRWMIDNPGVMSFTG
jgi:polyphosphate kinase